MATTFQSNAALKNAILQRVQNHILAGQAQPTSLSWDGSKGSIVACAIESSDLNAWTDALALPKWLALLIDAIVAGLAATPETTKGEACEAGRSLLEAIPVGVDISLGGSAFLIGLLEEVNNQLLLVSENTELMKLAGRAKELHRRVLVGESTDASQWRSLRQDAVVQTDVFPEGSVPALLASVIEASVWDPRNSPSVVVDTLRQLSRSSGARALAIFGWTDADDEHTRARLKEIDERLVKGNPNNKRTVFEHYAEEFPEEKARLHRRMHAEQVGVGESVRVGLHAISNVLLEASGK
jgi:hypothetical protein